MHRGLGIMGCSFGGGVVVRGMVPTREPTFLALGEPVYSLKCLGLVAGFSEENGQKGAERLKLKVTVKLRDRDSTTTGLPRTIIQRG